MAKSRVLLAAASRWFVRECHRSPQPLRRTTRSGSRMKVRNVTVIDGNTLKVLGTMPVSKRPRGIHSSPDGRTVYVALSGTPIAAPPKLDANGNPIFEGLARMTMMTMTTWVRQSGGWYRCRRCCESAAHGQDQGGIGPRRVRTQPDGRKLYVSNEDVRTASIVDIGSGKVEHIILVGQEPEGVAVSPDGNRIYVTCETSGDILVVDAHTYKTLAHFKVPPRPRSWISAPMRPLASSLQSPPGCSMSSIRQLRRLRKRSPCPKGSRPMRVRVAPDNAKVYVSDGRAGTVTVLDAHLMPSTAASKSASAPGASSYRPMANSCFRPTVRRMTCQS